MIPEKEYLDGPAFIKYLIKTVGMPRARAAVTKPSDWARWQHGAAVSEAVADRILTRLEMPLSLVPDEVWL